MKVGMTVMMMIKMRMTRMRRTILNKMAMPIMLMKQTTAIFWRSQVSDSQVNIGHLVPSRFDPNHSEGNHVYWYDPQTT